uniref:C2 domain-containing protein n=1 Tax=Triticum urartu TaxID=4572 RepID=A0A8R7TBZ6_TRIUA
MASCNAFVEVEVNGQRQRTATRPGDLSPQWKETLFFDVRDPARFPALTVDVSVQHDHSLNDHNSIRMHAFLGRVRVSGPRSPDEAVVLRFPLDKRGLFLRVSGDMALRLYLVAD